MLNITHGCNCFGVVGAKELLPAKCKLILMLEKCRSNFYRMIKRKYYLSWRNIELLGNIVHYSINIVKWVT